MSEAIQFVIYDHPRDDPDHWVVRKWDMSAAAERGPSSWACDSLERARELIAQHTPGCCV